MYMNKWSISLLLVLVLMLGACSSDKKDGKKGVTAKAQSAPYELLVVADKEWLKTSAGQSLMVVVESPVEVLPQVEPCFRVTTIDPRRFDGVFKFYSNIVVAEVGKKYTKAEVRRATNLYAQPQTVLYVCAPDNQSFVSLMKEKAAYILSEFNDNEFARERSLLMKEYSGVAVKNANKMFGADIRAPKDVDDVKQGKDFVWFADSKREFRQNVCLYTLPLRDMTLDMMVAARDSVMQANIPGEREGQWVETDPRSVLPDVASCGKESVFVMRGLWRMRHGAMGGPFVAYYVPDTVRGRIVVAEGFVFAPDEKKKPIMRQLEAALQTLTLDTQK